MQALESGLQVNHAPMHYKFEFTRGAVTLVYETLPMQNISALPSINAKLALKILLHAEDMYPSFLY